MTHADRSFLRAAEEVLRRAGRPMHYETIAQVAIRLGLVDSNSKTPDIIMSTVLSADIRKNPTSIFRKVRPGVFALSDTARASESTPQIIGRLQQLATLLRIGNESALVRRLIYLFRVAIEIGGRSGAIRLEGNRTSVDLRVTDLPQVSTRRILGQRPVQRISVRPDIVSALEEIIRQHGLTLQTGPLETALRLLEISVEITSDSVVISGQWGQRRVQLYPRSASEEHRATD